MASGLLANARISAVNFAREVSIFAKCGCVVLSLFYALSFLFNPLKPLGITPGNLIPPNFWIWTIFTHQLIEINIVCLILSFGILLYSCTVLEPLWGFASFGTFFAVTTVFSGLFSAAVYLVCYVLTFRLSYLFEVEIYGFAGYTGGFLVALKQCRGDAMLIGSIGLYVKHLPLLYVLLCFVLRLIGFLPGGNFVLSIMGVLVSWTFLRFYQSHNRGRGDSAENFAFKTFFPQPLESPVGVLSDAIFKVLLKFRICRKTSYRYDVGAPSKITLTLSGIDALDAERRRLVYIFTAVNTVYDCRKPSRHIVWIKLNMLMWLYYNSV